MKVEEIRTLKKKILQSSILQKDRFIILDDVELFNINSLNALLKIIEEPGKKNFFFLINNKSKPLLNTIKSRALEFKIILKEDERLKIIDELVKIHKVDVIVNPIESKLTPGNFLKFNYICKENDLFDKYDLIQNLSTLLNLYKKNKDIIFINVASFIVDHYFNNLKNKKKMNINKIFEIKNFIFKNLNDFLFYNINQSTLINAVNDKLKYD